MKTIVKEIQKALDIFDLPVLVSLKDVKKRYRQLCKKYHPDHASSEEKMHEINEAYELLKAYMENYKFTFQEDEILKQFPEENHATRFRF